MTFFTFVILLLICISSTNGQTDSCYAKPLRIAVIDGFTNKRIDLDNDGIGDLSHGDMIVRFLGEGLPNAEIVKFDLENPDIPLYVWRMGPGYQLEILLNRIISEIENGALNVGALNEDGTKSVISGDNVLINRWARSEFSVYKNEDGVDFTGDGTTDLSFEDLSAAGENLIKNLIGGTSVAVPIAIIEDFSVIKK